MSGNAVFALVASLAVAAHLVALVWALRSRRGVTLLLALNGVVALSVLGYHATRLRFVLAAPRDEAVLLLIAFEALVLGAALWALGGRRAPLVLSTLAFALHVRRRRRRLLRLHLPAKADVMPAARASGNPLPPCRRVTSSAARPGSPPSTSRHHGLRRPSLAVYFAEIHLRE